MAVAVVEYIDINRNAIEYVIRNTMKIGPIGELIFMLS